MILISGGEGGGGECDAEVSGVEAGFVEKEIAFRVEFAVPGSRAWSFGGGEKASLWMRSFEQSAACSAEIGQDRGFGPQRNFPAGELFYPGEVVWIEGEAEAGECGELWRIFGVIGGEHSGGGPGRLGHRAAAFEDDD